MNARRHSLAVRPEEVVGFMKREHGATTVATEPAEAIDPEERARRVDALMGKYAHAAFSTEDLFRERREDRAREERAWEPHGQ